MNFLARPFMRPQKVIERLLLPYCSLAAKQFIDASSRRALDRMHDFRETPTPAIRAAKRTEDQMCMIGHHDSGEKFELAAVVSETAIKNNFSRFCRTMQTTRVRKRNEQCPLIFLR